MSKRISLYSIPLEVAPAVLLTLDNQIIEAVRANNYDLADDLLYVTKKLRWDMEEANEDESPTIQD